MKLSTHTFRSALAATSLALVLMAAGCKKPVDDATLTNNVKAKITADSSIASEPIQVAVQDGSVMLNGTVSNEAARTLAANDAAGVDGVKQVVNNLAVAPVDTAPVTSSVAPLPAPAAPVEAAPVEPKKKKVAKKIEPIAPAPVVRQPAPAPPPAPVVAAKPLPPPPPPKPTYRDVTVASGTVLPIRLTQTLSSESAQQGDSFSGTLAADVLQDGVVVLRRGDRVSGRVTDAKDATHFKGSSMLAIQLVSLSQGSDRFPISTDTVSQEGKGRGKNTAVKTGIGAAVGAGIGALLGGGKAAAIGAGVGGAGGAGINAVTKGEQVQFPSESILRFHLESPITVRIPSN